MYGTIFDIIIALQRDLIVLQIVLIYLVYGRGLRLKRFFCIFCIGQGVRQGCILSLHLFNVYSEKVMRNALEGSHGSVQMGGKTVANLLYADDIVLTAGSMKELETLVTNVYLASEQAGLKLNTQNTTGDQENIETRDLVINGENIETVENFIYLSENIKNDSNDSKEIRRRLTIARNAVISLNNI